MDEFLYMTGSISAIVLLVGHVGWGIIRLARSVGTHRRESLTTSQFERLQQDLTAQLDTMRNQIGSALDEVHDRLDFTERVLTKGREDGPNRG